MARIRTIKPELWTDPEFVECSPNARLLFVAALNFASDYGVLPDKPRQLKMQCFPGDEFDLAPLVDELVSAGLWQRRTAPDGAKVLVIRTFTRHQKVEKPSPGRWGNPAQWPEIRGPLPDPSPNGSRTVDDASPPEGNGREGNGREGNSLAHAHDAQPPTLTLVPPVAPDKPAQDTDFDRWWHLYPRKVDRARAVKAWNRIRGPDRAAALNAIGHHAAHWQTEHREPRHIPHPATWLNGRRWEDELVTPGETRRLNRSTEAFMRVANDILGSAR